MTTPPLRLVAMEITRTCVLSCRHCRGDSLHGAYEDELSFEEISAIFERIAAFAKPIMIITGGEPLTRPDVFDIAQKSSSLGFITTLATCGGPLDDEAARKLVKAGVVRISVSLDGPDADTHDRFRCVPGAFDAALRGIETARRNGLPFQVNSTITSFNVAHLTELHDLALSLGAEAFHPFLLVPTGRGKGLEESALGPEEYERVLAETARLAARSPLEIKPTCSPHYVRIAAGIERGDTVPPKSETHATPAGGAAGHGSHGRASGGCLGGKGFVFVSHRGKVQICGFLDLEAGDLRAEDYDLGRIWENSTLFREVRETEGFGGKCGRCPWVRTCGGCRARAYAATGDHLAEEPNCTYQPKGSHHGKTLPM